MNETHFTTDADVILEIYKDYKNLQARYKSLEEEKNNYRDAIARVINLIDKEEINRAMNEYNDRRDVERNYINARDIRKVLGVPEGICEEADRILREREEAEHEDEECKIDGE